MIHGNVCWRWGSASQWQWTVKTQPMKRILEERPMIPKPQKVALAGTSLPQTSKEDRHSVEKKGLLQTRHWYLSLHALLIHQSRLHLCYISEQSELWVDNDFLEKYLALAQTNWSLDLPRLIIESAYYCAQVECTGSLLPYIDKYINHQFALYWERLKNQWNDCCLWRWITLLNRSSGSFTIKHHSPAVTLKSPYKHWITRLEQL